jgi:hypothetical protein
MAPTQPIDLHALTSAISKGIVEGTTGVVSGLAESAKKRHDFREIVDQNVHKVWELDGEVKLLKGMMTSLIGTGDGSSGMVPRLERDMSALGKDMASVKATVQEMQADISGINRNIETILAAQQEQQNFVSEVKGGSLVGKFLIGMSVTVIMGVVSGLLWLMTHGVKP